MIGRCSFLTCVHWIALASAAVMAGDNSVHAQTQVVQQYIEQFVADVKTLDYRYRVPLDEEHAQRRADHFETWLGRLKALQFEKLDRDAQIDYILLRSELDYRQALLKLNRERDEAAATHLPYAGALVAYFKQREEVEPIQAQQLAEILDKAASAAEDAAAGIHAHTGDIETQTKITVLRSCELISDLRRALTEADRFYKGYNPEYTWWAEKPMQRLQSALAEHRKLLREKIVGVPDSDKETIIGLPIGREGLAVELAHEWIAHDPAELVELARREFAWCDAEMDKASRELGFGSDWRAAMEHVKSKHVSPGEQPQMIKDLAWEAIHFLEAHDLVTVPPLAANGWRMTMMSPEAQRVNPYFLGGDQIIVSFPTNTMTHQEKLMSMRSNNEHFSRATVHHELIPGHHLQYYMLPRHRPYREIFKTPFWIEGWALYWEMLLWDLDFAQSPEDRVGMLFWRKHRCARIIFSLSYHLGEMTPEECIDYLVERVGHERSAATAEVRRSIMGGYSALYQAAYMLGGLQIRQMHKETVQGGKMTNRAFHDAILHQHAMPIEVLRLALGDSPLTADQQPTWRFADPPKK